MHVMIDSSSGILENMYTSRTPHVNFSHMNTLHPETRYRISCFRWVQTGHTGFLGASVPDKVPETSETRTHRYPNGAPGPQGAADARRAYYPALSDANR